MAQARGVLAGVVDRSIGWYLGLPTERGQYRVTNHVRIPMRDGIELAADLYEPIVSPDAKPGPLLLVQGCYGRGIIMALMNARLFAARGYKVLFVSCRGTFGSGGSFEPGRAEQRDGQDIVAWMRQQPWYAGSFATLGASYLGYTQWALLHDPPPDCVAALIAVGPHDYARYHWGTGSLRLDRIVWGDTIAHQEDPGLRVLPAVSRLVSDAALARSVYLRLPLIDSVRDYLTDSAAWVTEALAHPDVDDVYWEPLRHGAALERVNVPVFLLSGWHDMFAEQTLDQYARLQDRGCTVYLTIGPWAHVGASGLHSMPEMLQFLDHHVAGLETPVPALPVRFFVTGADEWRTVQAWPPRTQQHILHLHGDRTLKAEEAPDGVQSCFFDFDPADPTPTIGGPMLTGGGRVDDSEYASRSDVLVYTSEPLEEDVEVLGKPTVELAHSSDTPFVDLWVRLSEVDAKGVSHNVTELYRSLDSSRDQSSTLRIVLRDCAHRFCRGTRVRLIIAGGSLPQFAPNLGTDGSRTEGTTRRIAHHTIKHSSSISRVLLPASA